jgi:hypothetical protein
MQEAKELASESNSYEYTAHPLEVAIENNKDNNSM